MLERTCSSKKFFRWRDLKASSDNARALWRIRNVGRQWHFASSSQVSKPSDDPARSFEEAFGLKPPGPESSTERTSVWVRTLLPEPEPDFWQFTKGSDLSDAKINNRDPSKFWIYLEAVDDPKKSKYIELCENVLYRGGFLIRASKAILLP